MDSLEPRLIAVMGPTGSGKSSVAEELAERLSAQLINADAFHVYRGFDIGTSKPDQRQRYQLIDVADPDQQYGVGEWIREVLPLLESCYKSRRHVVVVGGTGLYIRALFEEFTEMSAMPDPSLRAEIEESEKQYGIGHLIERLRDAAPAVADRVDLSNPVRVKRALEKLQLPKLQFKLPPFIKSKFAMQIEPDQLDMRLSDRLDQMLAAGWIPEVASLMQRYNPEKSPAFRAIGYHNWVRLLRGELSLEEGKVEVFRATRAYAKRQQTWVRKEPGVITLTRNTNSDEESASLVDELIHHFSKTEGS